MRRTGYRTIYHKSSFRRALLTTASSSVVRGRHRPPRPWRAARLAGGEEERLYEQADTRTHSIASLNRSRLKYEARHGGWTCCEASCDRCGVPRRIPLIEAADLATHPPHDRRCAEEAGQPTHRRRDIGPDGAEIERPAPVVPIPTRARPAHQNPMSQANTK
jgi:hypothetical protein